MGGGLMQRVEFIDDHAQKLGRLLHRIGQRRIGVGIVV